MSRILVIDNYDSFTYNLVHVLREQGATLVDVVRNDAVPADLAANYDKLVLSPGPGIPEEAGQLPDTIRAYKDTLPMLGVCLGHQAIAEVFGSRIFNLDAVHHGVSDTVTLTADAGKIFDGVGTDFEAGRYHSWAVEPASLAAGLVVTATTSDGTIMAMRHRELPIHGLQFHPESILTPAGPTILKNWINS